MVQTALDPWLYRVLWVGDGLVNDLIGRSCLCLSPRKSPEAVSHFLPTSQTGLSLAPTPSQGNPWSGRPSSKLVAVKGRGDGHVVICENKSHPSLHGCATCTNLSCLNLQQPHPSIPQHHTAKWVSRACSLSTSTFASMASTSGASVCRRSGARMRLRYNSTRGAGNDCWFLPRFDLSPWHRQGSRSPPIIPSTNRTPPKLRRETGLTPLVRGMAPSGSQTPASAPTFALASRQVRSASCGMSRVWITRQCRPGVRGYWV